MNMATIRFYSVASLVSILVVSYGASDGGNSTGRPNTTNITPTLIRTNETVVSLNTTTTTTTASPESSTSRPPITTAVSNEKAANKSARGGHHGSHRIRGGVVQPNVPGYISTIWSRHQPADTKDGLMTGMGIKLSDRHTLIHDNSWTQARHGTPNTGRDDLHRISELSHSQQVPLLVQSGNPPDGRLNVNTGWKGMATRATSDDPYHKIHSPNQSEGQGPFAVLEHSGNWNAGKPHATLERDKNVFGSNCHLHGYSHDANNAGSRAGEPMSAVRKFAKFPVHTPTSSDCNNGFCKLTANGANSQICHHADRGAPITCGPDQKVTYLAMPDWTSERDCTREIKAYHVPQMMDRIDKTMKKDSFNRP